MILGLVIFSYAGSSFTQGNFRGIIKDKQTGEGIINATIIYGEGMGVVSDIHGDFLIENPTYPLKLEISHLSYLPKTITVRRTLENRLTINMEASELNVDQVEILGEKLNRFFERKFFYVTDYAFIDDKIAIIGYDQGRLNHAKLILTNLSQDTLSSRSIKRPKKLFRDGFGTVHLFAGDSVYQIAVIKNKLELLYPTHEADFSLDLQHLQIAEDHTFIFKDIYGDGQLHMYTLVDTITKTTDTLKHVFDHQSFKGVRVAERHKESRLRKLTVDYKGQMDWRPGVVKGANRIFTFTHFKNNIINKPITSQVFVFNNEYIILDIANYEIHSFTRKSLKELTIPLEIPHHTNRNKYFVQDAITGKIYWVYYQGDRALLGEVDPATGKIVDQLETPRFQHIEDIKIRNGVVWFLYQARLGEDVRSLYRMR